MIPGVGGVLSNGLTALEGGVKTLSDWDD